MRKIKTIKIDDREIIIKELRVKDIKAIFDSESENTLMDHLPLVTDLSATDIEDLAPSELSLVWNAVKEVNADFLALMEKSGITKSIEATAMQILMKPSSASSNPAIMPSWTMDTVSSLPQ